ncbi:MAG: methylated-DNA--[protein]-cysteine S-methyltransferase [Cytophagales bacterium]|nr:methylated-DNA--[protein]-cysteine S-methyltransferase [Armatimonadota bacterium]
MTVYTITESPVGPLQLISNGDALTGLFMNQHKNGPETGEDWMRDDENALLIETRTQLAAYFAGERKTFDLPMSPRGTDFQRRVWSALSDIPYGVTISYGELARRIGDPKASRAVGMANGSNPLSIIVPCHRVIGASGKLTGYGGGIERKRALLALEGCLPGGGAPSFSFDQSVTPSVASRNA